MILNEFLNEFKSIWKSFDALFFPFRRTTRPSGPVGSGPQSWQWGKRLEQRSQPQTSLINNLKHLIRIK